MSDNKAEAGWYPDPHNSTQQRYYDGEQWTDHYAPAAGATPAEAWDTPRDGDSFSTGQGLTDVGSMMSAAWSALMKRVGSLIGLTIAVGVISAILVAILAGVAVGSGSAGITIVIGIVVGLLIVAAYAAYQLIVARVFLAEHQGTTLSIADAWDQTKGRIVPFLGTVIGIGIVCIVALGIIGAIFAAISPVLFILFLPIFAFLWVKLGFIPTAAAATSSGSILEGSLAVSKDRFWPIFGRLIVLALVAIVWSLIMQVVTAAVANSAALLVIVSLVSMIGSLLASLFIAAGTSKVFLETGGKTDVRVGQV